METNHYDVIVIGGGPAGSSAALILGRSRLKVLLIDKATPRNIRTKGVHGFLTRHNISPKELRKLAHAEVMEVGVELIYGEVEELRPTGKGFVVGLSDQRTFRATRVVVATGSQDHLPEIEGLDRFYGTSVFHCPFCDGWEWRDRAIGVIAGARKGPAIAKGLLTWSMNIHLFTDGVGIPGPERSKLEMLGIILHTEKIKRVSGRKDQLEKVELVGGVSVDRDVIFFDPQANQQSDLVTGLGCAITRSGAIRTDKRQRTGVPGLYVCGDAAADPNMVVVAAADGVKAAINIVQEMQKAGHWFPRKK